jgi:uncharacterized SAM-binding protein YcdF (DUF218 family)
MAIGIILGCGVGSDGALHGEALRRVRRGERLLRSGRVSHIVLCGAGAPIAEADAMRALLVSDGVDPRKLVVERSSLDTIGNAVYAREKIGPSDEPIVIVTSKQHARRALMVFRHIFGREDISVVHSDHPVRSILSWIREEELRDIEGLMLRLVPPGDIAAAKRFLRTYVPQYGNAHK